MGEVKNAFIKSKMNKDLDARLIPSGEYRNAVNVQVSKSEGSTVGSLENALGNDLVLDYFALTGVNGLNTIGYLANEIDNTVYLFLTDNTTGIYTPGTSGEVGSNNFIISYNTVTNPSTSILVQGAFLNFSTVSPIFGVNALEDLLFWTDNRNQPRKISISKSLASSTYYSNEDQISVAKYNPYGCINLFQESTLSPGNFETTMFDVVSELYPDGGTGLVSVSMPANSFIIPTNSTNFTDFTTPANIVGSTVSVIDATTGVITTSAFPVLSYGFSIPNQQNEISFGSGNSTGLPALYGPGGSNPQTKLIFNINPYYDATYNGDPNFLEDKFVRFGYRFQFEQGEYSIFSPFTQAAFIPKQDGYFLKNLDTVREIDIDDESAAYRSTIVEFMENKVNKILLNIPLPFAKSSMTGLGENSFKISSIDILYKESDALAVKVVETIDMSVVQANLDGGGDNYYNYNYQSKKPYKTLPSSDLIRVYDKIPVRALGQEIISNRVVYSNFQDKHTPPANLDYNLLVSAKDDFDLNISTVSTSGTTNGEKTIQVTVLSGTVFIGGILTGTNVTDNTRIVSFSGTALETDKIQNGILDGITLTIKPSSDVVNSTSIVEYPNHSLKQNRNYQVGVVLSDRFGRSSGVILSSVIDSQVLGGLIFVGSTIYSPYRTAAVDPSSWPGDSLKVLFNDTIGSASGGDLANEPGIYNGDATSSSYNPLGWYSYKIVVKQTEQEYYNVYLPGVLASYPNDATLELGKTSFASLIGDNINKVPRDLSEVGPQQKQFRSSVELFGRVENNLTGTVYSNTQYFPTRFSSTVSTIATNNDLFNGDNLPSYQPTNDFYEIESNPLIAKISTNKKFGIVTDSASATLSVAMTNVSNITDLVEIKGVFKIGDIVTGTDVTDNTSVVSKTASSVQLSGLQTLSTRTILTFNDPEPVYSLAIFETAPVESNLDIFWETSTSGIISELNNVILNDSNGAAGIGGWSTSNFSEATLAATQQVSNNDFTIVDNKGVNIPNGTISVQSIALTGVRDANGLDVQSSSNGPRFALTTNGAGTAYNVQTIAADYTTFDWVFGLDASLNKNFTFTFSVVTEDSTDNSTFTSVLSETAQLVNAAPSFGGGLTFESQGICPSGTISIGNQGEIFVYKFYGTNGAAFSTLFPGNNNSGGIYESLTFVIVSVVNNLSPTVEISNAFSITQIAAGANGSTPRGCDIKKISSFETAGNYSVKIGVSDAATGSRVDCVLSVTITDTSCIVSNRTCDRSQYVIYTDCSGNYPTYLYWNPIDNNVTKGVPHLVGTTPSGCLGQTGGSCFLAESKVEMFDGSLKAISKIVKGDKVRSIMKGKVVEGTVTDRLHRSIYENQHVVNINGITAEFNHPVFVDGKWIPIADLGTTVETFVEDFYNLEIDGDIEESEHNFTIGGLIVSGLSNNVYLNNKYQRQPKHLTAWLEGNNSDN